MVLKYTITNPLTTANKNINERKIKEQEPGIVRIV